MREGGGSYRYKDRFRFQRDAIVAEVNAGA